jgi:hypothetical protein
VHNEFALYQRQVDASMKAVIAAGYLKPWGLALGLDFAAFAR